jgi:Tfp pilus assembly protein PilN
MVTINLLPPELRRSGTGIRFSKSTLMGTVAVVVFLGILAGVTFFQSVRLKEVQADIGRSQAQVERLRDDIRLVDRLEDVKTKILRRMSAIESLDRGRGNWVNNVEDILAVIPDYLWLSGFQKEPQRGSAAAVDTLPSAPRYVFNGFCFTISSLANLIMNMQDSPRFAHISLHSANLEQIENRRVYEFEVACELEPISAESTGFGDEPEETPELGWKDEEEGDALASDRAWNEPPLPAKDSDEE